MRYTILFLLTFLLNSPVLSGDDIVIDKKFTGWVLNNRSNTFSDPVVKVSRHNAVRLQNGAKMFRTFSLEPDSVYELSFYTRGEKISQGNDGARIIVNGGKQWVRFTSNRNNAPETGSFDWKKGTGRIDTSRLGKTVRIYLAAGKKGTVWYDELKLIKKSTVEKKKIHSFRQAYGNTIKRVYLIPRGISGIFKPEEKVTFDILLESAAKDLEYAVTVKDENGRICQEIPLKKLTDSFTLSGQPAGYYVVEGSFFQQGKKVYDIQSSFISAPEILKRDPFFQMGFGLQPDMPEAIRRIGTGTISFKLSAWASPGAIGKPQRIWNWLYTNRIKPYLDAGGFNYAVCIGTSLSKSLRTPEEIQEGQPLINDKLLKQYKDFISIALKTLKGQVKEWTFQQETPSNAVLSKYAGTWSEAMANFVVLVRIGSRQIRRSLPDAHILAGGCNVRSTLKDIERITLSDLTKEFDTYIIDAYTGNWNLTLGDPTLPETELMAFYREASDLAASLGKNKKIRNEELGYCINYGSPLDKGLAVVQAELTARQLILTKASPVDGFELHMPTFSTRENIRDEDRCMTTVWRPVMFKGKLYQIPLPGGAMYVTAASQLAFVHSPRLFFRESLYSCVFSKPDKSTLLILWDTNGNREFNITLPCPAEMFSMYGRKKQLNAGVQKLSIGKAPVYLRLKYPAEKTAQLVKSAIISHIPEFKGAGFCIAPGKAKIFIRNLTPRTRSGMLQGRGKITLLPDKITCFEVRTSSDVCRFTAADNKVYNFNIQQNIHPVRRVSGGAKLDGTGLWLKGLKPGRLQYPRDIRPQSALQPELSYFRTSFNPDGHNISARYWTGYDDSNFYIAVKVDDPIHLQRFNGRDIHRDDSLQVVFSTQDTIPHELQESVSLPEKSQLNYGFALTSNGPTAVKFLGKNSGIRDIPVNVTRKNKETFYEIAVPFKELGGRPVRFGFVIFNNDFTTKRSAPYWLEFSPGVTGNGDAGKLKLIEYK